MGIFFLSSNFAVVKQYLLRMVSPLHCVNLLLGIFLLYERLSSKF